VGAGDGVDGRGRPYSPDAAVHHVRFDVATISYLIAAQLEVDPARVTLTARFTDDLGADDVQIDDLMLALEEHFDIDISNDQVSRLGTLDDVLHFLDSHGYVAERS
jgi:acyl carrier protein